MDSRLVIARVPWKGSESSGEGEGGDVEGKRVRMRVKGGVRLVLETGGRGWYLYMVSRLAILYS